MKRALVISLAVGMVAAIAFATMADIRDDETGFYFHGKQALTILEYDIGDFTAELVQPPAWVELGWDLRLEKSFAKDCPTPDDCGKVIDEVLLIFEGNIFVANRNLWSHPAEVVTGLDFEFIWGDWGLAAETAINFQANYSYWPNFMALKMWTMNVNASRFFGASYLSTGLDLVYQHFNSVGALQMFPYIEGKIYF